MRSEVLQGGEHMITVCNACRYCEQYCPVFPAMEERRRFGKADLVYLANLCHNCGECLYACQYAPPHEFGINLPRQLAELRVASYEEYCWPPFLAGAFRRHGLVTGMLMAAVLSGVMFAAVWWMNPAALTSPAPEGDFYAVIPHAVMIALFGGVSLFIAAALALSLSRFWRAIHPHPPPLGARAIGRGLRDALTLTHLHSNGIACATNEELRTPWRRRFHHATFYGFLLCFASTSVAATYHALGWSAPYPYMSLPVILGIVGGIGLLVGPVGLMVDRRRRDPALSDPGQNGLDESFLGLLFLTSLTGLLLLVLREHPAMPILLIVHLGIVLALFVTLPYGKFVHGLYRLVALMKYHH